MLHSKALQLIQDKAVKAAGVAITPIPGDDTQVIISQEGRHEFHVMPPKPRAHKVESLADFCGAVEEFRITSVWVDEVSVVGIIDREKRRDQVIWPLRYTKPFTAVKALDGTEKRFNQTEIIRWLKFDLWQCVEDETLIPTLRNIKWKNHAAGTSKIGGGNASIGMQLEQELQGNERPLPETFAVNVRVHENFGEDSSERIILSLDPDPANCVFLVEAIPDEIPRTIERRLTHIQQRLDESIGSRFERSSEGEDVKVTIPVFFGKP